MTAIRILIFLALILGLTGCGTIHPTPSYGYGATSPALLHSAHTQAMYPATLGPNGKFVVNTSTPMSAYSFNAGMAPGAHPAYIDIDGRWNIAGFTQASPPMLIGGGTPTTMIGVSAVGGQATLLGGMTPDTAARLLAELDRQDNPCASSGRTYRVSIGAALGAVVGAVLNGGRGAVVGALIGAAGGNAEAGWSCEAYTATRANLQAVLDQYGCSGQVRKVNGIVSDDEICNFRRGYNPAHSAPQVSDRTPVRVEVPVPAPSPQPVVRTPTPTPARGAVVGGPPDRPLPPK